MSTNFPTALDTFTNPTPENYLNSPSHSGQHSNVNDAIEAIEAKLGIDGSADTNSIDYKINNMQTSFGINVKDFGAVGDNVTDDTEAFQDALDAAAGLDDGEGHTVYIPAGIYKITDTLVMGKYTVMQGEGKRTSVLHFNNAGDGVQSTAPINTSTSVWRSLRDLRLDNSNAGCTGAGFVDVCGTYVNLIDIDINGFGYCLILDQSELFLADRCAFTNAYIANVWIVNNDEHTTGASAEFTNRVDFTHNQFGARGGVPNVVDDGGASHNYIGNNFDSGTILLRLARARNCSVIGNEFESGTVADIEIGNETYWGGAEDAGTEVLIESNFLGGGSGSFACIKMNDTSEVSTYAARSVIIMNNLFGSCAGARILNTSQIYYLFSAGNGVDGSGALFDGTAANHFVFDASEGAGHVFNLGASKIKAGSGSPEGVVTAPVGSIFLRDDGSTSTTLYVKTSGSGNTGWTAK